MGKLYLYILFIIGTSYFNHIHVKDFKCTELIIEEFVL